MKSLVESLFGDNIKSGWVFGDLFEFYKSEVAEKPTGRGGRETWGKNWALENLYHWKMIAKDSKVQGDTPEETVVKGLIELISKLKVTPESTNKEINKMIQPFEKYYKAIVNNTLRLRINSRPHIFNCGSNMFQTQDVWTINDLVDFVEIDFSRVKLYFKKKQ